jgi:hypothetical protein
MMARPFSSLSRKDLVLDQRTDSVGLLSVAAGASGRKKFVAGLKTSPELVGACCAQDRWGFVQPAAGSSSDGRGPAQLGRKVSNVVSQDQDRYGFFRRKDCSSASRRRAQTIQSTPRDTFHFW